LLPVIPVWVHLAAAVALAAGALWRGEPETRFAALYSLVTSVAYFLIGAWIGGDARFFAVTAALDAAVFLVMALRSDRYWTLAAASISLVNFATDVGQVFAPVARWAIGTTQLVWFYAFNLTVLAGVLQSSRRKI
jgi:hypothetical protein